MGKGGKAPLLIMAALGVGGILLFKHFKGGGSAGVVPTAPAGVMDMGDGQGTVNGPLDTTVLAGPSANADLWTAGGSTDPRYQGLSFPFSQAYSAKMRKAYPSYFWDFRNPGVSYNDNILYNKMPFAAPSPGYQSFWNPQDTTTLKFAGSLNCECCNPRVVPKSI